MKKSLYSFCVITFLSFLSLGVSPLKAANLSGTYTVPGTINSTQVNNLSQLAALLSADSVTGTAIFEFTTSYTSEPQLPVIFTKFAGGGHVIIRPAGANAASLLTLGGPGARALIDLDGASNISFDGRAGGTGGINWSFQNFSSGSAYPVFRFINGAAFDTLQYLSILGSPVNTTAIIRFDTCHTAGGNSNNAILFDSIGNYSGLVFNSIYSSGKKGPAANANNSIIGNNIFNFKASYLSLPTNGGIIVTSTGNGGGWNISDNSFYSTDTTPAGSTFMTVIYFAPGDSSSGNILSGNFIGGRAPHGGTNGEPWVFNGSRVYTTYMDFTGIHVSVGTGATTTVSNNTIGNIALMNGTLYGTSQTFCGIHIGDGLVNVIRNTIGNATYPASVHDGNSGMVLGIWNESKSAVTIDHNIVANLKSDFSSHPQVTTDAGTVGIYSFSMTNLVGSNTITNNKVYSLSSSNNYNTNQYFPLASGGCGTGVYACIAQMHIITGISLQTTGSANQVISENQVYNLMDSIAGLSNKIYIDGISALAGTGTVTINGNRIYGLYTIDSFGRTGYFAGMTGIYLPPSYNTKYYITNNMIQLGTKPTDGSSVINAVVTGIWDNYNGVGSGLKEYIYHNSVYIGGTDNNSHGNDLNSYAFRRDVSSISGPTDSLSIYNNIFVNNRSSASGSGRNFGIYLNAGTNVSSDYNIVYGTGTNFNYGGVLTVAYSNLIAFQAGNLGLEEHSIVADPLFFSPRATIPELHVHFGSPANMAGTATNTWVYDYDSLPRASLTPVDIGATAIGTCPGNVYVYYLTDSVCNGGTYTFNGTTINVPGTYSDTLPVPGGCDSIVVLNLTSVVTPYITQLGSDTLFAGLFEKYQWLLNDTALLNANAQFYVTEQNGNYTVIVTYAGGCVDTSLTFGFLFSGIKDLSDDPRVQIFPNPALATDGWYLQADNGLNGSKLELYDENGRVVWTSQIRSQKTNIQANIAPGIYWLRISSPAANLVRKLIRL